MISFPKIILILISWLTFLMHPVHVSITSVEFKSDENKLDISFKVFKDDFRLLFVHLNEIDIDFIDNLKFKSNFNVVDQYFKDHFIITIGNKQESINFVNYKPDGEYLIFDYSIKEISSIQDISIKNIILMDLYFDQKNLLILKSGEKEDGYRFDYQNQEFLIEM